MFERRFSFARRALAGAAAAAVLASCMGNAAAQTALGETAVDSEASARLNAWFEERFNQGVARYPQYLTALGRRDRYDEWNDPSDAFTQETFDIMQQSLWEMRAQYDYDALDPDTRLSYRLFEYSAEMNATGHAFRHYWFAFNQMYGAQSTTPTFLMNQHRIESVSDAEAYITRLETMDDYLGQVIENSRQRFEEGIAPPRFVYAHVLEAARNIVRGAPFEPGEPSALLADFTRKLDALELDPATRDDLVARAVAALQGSVAPVYAQMIAELERQQSLASTDDGVWRLPNGEAFYAYQLRQYTTTDLSAEEIHEIGLREVARIHDEMREIMNEVGFEGSLQDFFAFMRTDEQFFFDNTDEGREAYLELARGYQERITDRLPDMFNRFPLAPLEVRRVEPFREAAAGKAFYQRPSEDGSRPGYFYANLRDMADMPTYQLEALVHHEGSPGHHMQIAIAQELEGIPSFRRFGGYTAYVEGWGLYSERMPLEFGFYDDPYSNFGRLAMELWRAARLVVDTGIHHHRWTREEAIEYLVTNTPNPEGDCTAAIERYIVMPGQATAYMVGMLEIIRLRELAEAELGDAFDVRAFHDVVLANGAVPLEVLGELVEAWIAEEQSGRG